ncbi:hypothetical protein J2X47_000386 [Sphingomonas sp. BE270]|jgi:hypothetical protein|uniref:hypothetical protein n=1 Tax=Sphingomonas sp. BE270 TaxID=2817726 RepID=UPI00285E2EC6|nr:hypothetical protein [Sphingomonas sp. BE270]MDR7256225.1 hypothetical protein [Sphingomonas sp. BE270]
MPKMTERERLAKIEADQRNLAQEAETVRRGLRAQYGKVATEIAVERLSEREFRDVLAQAIRVGGGAALAALKALPAMADGAPERGSPAKAGGAARGKSGASQRAGSEAGGGSQAAVHP